MTMATFQYKAATVDGEVVDGFLSGSSREHVVEQLQATGHIPIRVDESAQRVKPQRQWSLRKQRVTEEQLGVATRELSTLLQAGLPLDRALAIMISLADGNPLAELLENIRDRVKQGATLADAMEAQGKVFSRFYLSLLRAGESGGALEVVLNRLADQMEQSKELRGALTSALIYPAILVVVAIVSILVLLGYVVPPVYADVRRRWPGPAAIDPNYDCCRRSHTKLWLVIAVAVRRYGRVHAQTVDPAGQCAQVARLDSQVAYCRRHRCQNGSRSLCPHIENVVAKRRALTQSTFDR